MLFSSDFKVVIVFFLFQTQIHVAREFISPENVKSDEKKNEYEFELCQLYGKNVTYFDKKNFIAICIRHFYSFSLNDIIFYKFCCYSC